MITILLVDDDEEKVKHVREAILSVLPEPHVRIAVGKNVYEGAKLLEAEQFDLLVLDINLPRRAGEGPKADAGVELLRQVYATRKFKIPRYIVGLTGFDERLNEFKDEFAARNWYLIRYNEGSDEWKARLSAILLHISDSKLFQGKEYKTDIAIITALEEVELESILALPGEWKATTVEGDPTIYHEGVWSRGTVSLSVVAAAAVEMGMPASTAIAMKLIHKYRPRYLAMCGIAAGVKGNLGDVLVADVAFDYGSGRREVDKSGSEIFAPDPHPIPLNPALKAKFSAFRRQPEILEKIRKGVTGGEVPKELALRMGPIASGAAVIKNRTVVDEVEALWRKLVGLEMESYGVFVAASLCDEPRPLPMSVKSICDFGDEKKSDAFQRYAAYTSASVFYEFALQFLQSPS